MTDSPVDPVTVVVRRTVKSGCEAEYEAWLERLIGEASTMPGYLGTHVHRPTASGPREYTSVFRFESVETLRGFEESDLRRRALLEVRDLVEADAIWEKFTGLEFWFTPPPGTVVPQPNRFRMALVLSIVVYGLVLSIGKLVAVTLADVSPSLRLLITIVIEVYLMVYVLMPWITRGLSRFIYPTQAKENSE